jgi:hypothetical protein
MKPNPKLVQKLVELMRDYSYLDAEVQILGAALLTAEKAGLLPQGWSLEALTAARAGAGYQNILHKHQALLAQLQGASDVAECMELLANSPLSRTVH